MSSEEFVRTRSERIDLDNLADILDKSLRKCFDTSEYDPKIENPGKAISLRNASLSVVRSALADIYNKMNPEHFEGYPDAKQVAEKLYSLFIKTIENKEQAPQGKWLLAGESTQDAWIAVAILSQKIWEEANMKDSGPRETFGVISSGEKTGTVVCDMASYQKKCKQLEETQQELQALKEKHLSLESKLWVLENNGKKQPIDAKEAREIRGNQYGHFHLNHEAVGQIWAGILSAWFDTRFPNIPASVVESMMVGLKVWRITRCPLNTDSHVDAANYLNMISDSQDYENDPNIDPTKEIRPVSFPEEAATHQLINSERFLQMILRELPKDIAEDARLKAFEKLDTVKLANGDRISRKEHENNCRLDQEILEKD